MKRLAAITGALAGLTAFVAFLAPAGATSERIGTAAPGAMARRATRMRGSSQEQVGSGVRATITALRQPSVSAGHAAGWIGVGGPGAGPNGETMWLQTGRRRTSRHAADGLCRDHSPRPHSLLPPAPRERRRRREPPARSARDERQTAALGESGSTDAPSRIRSSCPDRIAAGSRSRRRSRGTAVSRRATASASGSSGSAWPGR